MEPNESTNINQRRTVLIVSAVVSTVLIALIAVIAIVLSTRSQGAQSAKPVGQQFAQTTPGTPSTQIPGQTAPPSATLSPQDQELAALATDIVITPDMMTAVAATPMPPWQGTTRMNVLVLGIDQRPGGNPNRTRSDTMIIMTLDPASHTAGMLSMPRDLYVSMPNRGTQDRINAAHAYGGPTYAMRTVQANFGIPIQHYVRVNFSAVTTLVDLVGGIDVFVDQDINDPLYPSMNFGYDPFVISKGWHHMDGATALKYARTRHGSSDFFRMRRQQQIIMALRDRVLSTNALPQLLPKLPVILSTLSSSISTDMDISEMIQLIMFAKDLPVEKITRVVVDENAVHSYTTSAGASVQLPYRGKLRQLAAQLYRLPPALETVGVQNGTQTKGLAQSAQVYLQKNGYNVARATDAKDNYPKSIIFDYRGNNQFVQELADDLGLPTTAVTTSIGVSARVDVLVILGDDYQPKTAP